MFVIYLLKYLLTYLLTYLQLSSLYLPTSYPAYMLSTGGEGDWPQNCFRYVGTKKDFSRKHIENFGEDGSTVGFGVGSKCTRHGTLEVVCRKEREEMD